MGTVSNKKLKLQTFNKLKNPSFSPRKFGKLQMTQMKKTAQISPRRTPKQREQETILQ